MNSKDQREHALKEKQVATPAEARAAIEGLKDADYVKLMVAAKFFSRTRLGGGISEAEDLLQEAFAKTLEGTRRWNQAVTILQHLGGTMKSDSSHLAEYRAAHPTMEIPTEKREPKSERADVRTQIDAAEALEQVYALFQDDKAAMDVLELRGDGFLAGEIRQKLGMSKTEYGTVTTRIRRHIVRYLERGGE